MLKNTFASQVEFDIFKVEEKSRMEKGYLTRSEREQLKPMLEKDYKPRIIKEVPPTLKVSLVSDRVLLSKPGEVVTKEDDVAGIVKKLKDTLSTQSGLALTANQIGINKRISYLRIPKFNGKGIEFTEMVIINAKIIERDKPIKVNNEACLSFPGISVVTQRFVFCTVEYLDENLKSQVMSYQDLEAMVLQHEIDHQNGITLFDRKWRAR
jgi:peptide deformylase